MKEASMRKYAWFFVSVFVVVAAAWAWLQFAIPKPVLRVFTWEEYIDPGVVKDFEKEFNARVAMDFYSSNEDMRAKLQAGGGGYDIVVPTDYMVTLLMKAGLLAEIDLSRIPNLKHLSERFRDSTFDPGHRHSVPYLWGISGIGYRKDRVAKPPDSWADVFDASRLAPNKNRVSMLDDSREVIGAGLIHLGRSPNETDPRALEAAKALLLAQKPFLAKYDSESFEDSLASGETHLAHGWSGEISAAMRENDAIAFAVPREGVLLFVDNFAIPKGARNKKLAEDFINFMHRPEIGARNAAGVRYATTNEAAKALLPKAILECPAYVLPSDVKLWQLEDLGDAGGRYEKIWTEVKGN
jgi:spermidine/putrescine transport system substrate-binding protein